MKHIGMDEKRFGKGHDYVSALTDLDQGRVLVSVPTRLAEKLLLKTLPESQISKIQAIALGKAFMSAVKTMCPIAAIVHESHNFNTDIATGATPASNYWDRDVEGFSLEIDKVVKPLWFQKSTYCQLNAFSCSDARFVA
jgi:transposase